MRSTLVTIVVLVMVASGASAAEWQPLTADLLAKEKPGYGGLSGVVVDHATGQRFGHVSDRGVFRSVDGGKTWERAGKGPLKGRTETGGCFQIDPTGKTKRLLLPTVYGGPIAIGAADGGDWRILDKTSTHVDWCAADWTDAYMKFLLTLKHESGGLLLRSRDGGKSFSEIGKGHGPAWVFDADTAVGGLARTD